MKVLESSAVARHLVLSALFASACATSSQAPAPDRPVTAADYYPAAPGNSWAFDVERHVPGGGKEKVLVTARVTKVEGERFEVTTPDEVLAYERRPDGIFKAKSGYYMLKDPLAKGASWKILDDTGEVRIEKTGTTETTMAGTFERCVTVVEEIAGSQRVEWTYAPNVGPIRMRVWDLSLGEPTLLLDGTLRAYVLNGSAASGEKGDTEVQAEPPK